LAEEFDIVFSEEKEVLKVVVIEVDIGEDLVLVFSEMHPADVNLDEVSAGFDELDKNGRGFGEQNDTLRCEGV